jgi:hypothetical protein
VIWAQNEGIYVYGKYNDRFLIKSPFFGVPVYPKNHSKKEDEMAEELEGEVDVREEAANHPRQVGGLRLGSDGQLGANVMI